MDNQENKSIMRRVSRLWNRWTEPYASVTESETRQQSRLLSSLLLIAITSLCGLMLLFVQNSIIITNPGLWLMVSVVMIVLTIIAYRLSRSGRTQLASNIALGVGIPGIFIPALITGEQSAYTSLFYLLATTVYASIFLSIRAAVVVMLAQQAFLLALSSHFQGLTPAQIIVGPFSFNFFMGGLLLLVTHFRQQAVRQRQSELTASEERYRAISELISDYAYSMKVEPDGTMRYEWITDEPLKRLSGYSIDDLDVKRDRVVGQRLFHPDDVEPVRRELARTLKGEATHAEHRIITRSGEVRWLHMFRRPFWDEKEQRVTRLLGVAQDITARKQAEIALKENEEQYRIITEASSDMVSLYDGSGRILYISPSVERTMGYTLQELQSDPTSDRVHPEDFALASAGRIEAMQGNPVKGAAYRLRKKSGEYIWIETYSNPIKGDDGKIKQIVVSSRDITARKQTELALKASEERYRIITELISDYAFYYRLNPDGTRTREWITDSFTRLTGYTPDEVPGPTGDNLIHPEDRAAAEADRERVAQGENVSSEFRMFTKNGEQRWLSIHRHPDWDETHTYVVGSYGVAQDITARKQAEIALRENEERYRIITELISDYAYSLKIAPDGTLLHDWITEVPFLRATGYSHEELDEGEKVGLELYHPDEERSLRAELETTLRNEATHAEHRIITKSGEIRWMHLYRRPVWDEQERRVTRVYGVAQDITARKLAEIALKKSEERYRIISELISDYAYYFRIDPDGTRVREWVTESLLGVTGYTPEELPAGAEAKMFHPDDFQRAAEDRRRILKGESVSGEYRIVRKDGEQGWLNIRRRPVWDEAQQRVTGYYGVAQDITARKQADTQQMKLALEQEQRLMINQFMRALSHDFRTLLATIETSRYLIEKLLGDAAPQKVQSKLETIRHSVNHLANQLENLHMVSSLTNPQPIPSDLNHLIEGIVAEHTFKARQKQVDLHFEADAQLPMMQLDEVKIAQALRHLVANALTHTQAGGRVTVRTWRDHNHVLVQVHDTGSGIQPDALPHIFEPFYRGDESRTVDQGGVGLGLTIVKMTIDAHGGSIQVESEPGTGTVFRIQLPIPVLDVALAM